MDCDVAREAISALIDGEPPPVGRPELDAHLAGCGGCRAWREGAHDVTRRSRLAGALPSPGPDAAARSAAAARDAAPAWRREAVLMRASLVIVAAIQCVTTLPALVLGSDHGAPIHVAHEMGAFDMALAVGFVLAALRPSRARGMSSLVGAAAVLLIVTAVLDLAAGHTGPSEESPHLLAVAGWLLLRRLATISPADASGDGAPSLPLPLRGRRPAGLHITAPGDPDDEPRHAAVAAPPEQAPAESEPARRAASG
jgi:predicted anti-sigma-YlaC factor YlaD